MSDEDELADIYQPDEVDDTRPGRRKPIPDGALQAIIDRHRAAYLARDHDYDLRRPARKLVRGTVAHAKAFRRAPQWHQHVAVGPNGRKANYLVLIRDEAWQAFGPSAAEQIESLL